MNATPFTTLDEWARAPWAEAELGDRRRGARAVRVGGPTGRPPGGQWARPDADLGRPAGGRPPAPRAGCHPGRPPAALSTPPGRPTRAAAGGPEAVLFI